MARKHNHGLRDDCTNNWCAPDKAVTTRYGVWWFDGEGDRYEDSDGNIGFDYETACQIAQRIGGGIRKVGSTR